MIATNVTCPECGGPLDVEPAATISEAFHSGYHVAGRELPRRERTAAVAFCTRCEFCHEIRPPRETGGHR